jgi:hypothetical protein
VEATSYKVLGKAMKAEQAALGDPDKPGFFGFFGAEKGYIKAAWVFVLVMFLLHYLLVFGFHIPLFGTITIWVSVIFSFGMMIVVGIMGGYDLTGFLKKSDEKARLGA